jgi:hypothetical protein
MIMRGIGADQYYELVAGYNNNWVEGFPSLEVLKNEDFGDRSGAY